MYFVVFVFYSLCLSQLSVRSLCLSLSLSLSLFLFLSLSFSLFLEFCRFPLYNINMYLAYIFF